jgi:hypothetical protein
MMLARFRSRRVTITALLIAVTAAAAMTVAGIVPGTSADAGLLARKVAPTESLMDPWSGLWGDVGATTVTLSAQNATKPLGGGEVATVKARALQDGSRLYVMLEWADKTRDVTVNGQTAFADAAAMELPTVPAAAIPSFCMGQVDASVDIWHWKAVWQQDIDSGYTTGQTRYPDGFTDGVPAAIKNDASFYTARAAGNPLAQLSHSTPVENLTAGGFGTLTHADVQDVDGRGVWKDGRWRVVFARPLTTASGYPSLASGDITNIAFAVWDGSKGNRDGIKSVSQFMNLQISNSALPPPEGNSAWIVSGIVLGILAVVVLGLGWAYYGPRLRA